jgi:hypothetical protein
VAVHAQEAAQETAQQGLQYPVAASHCIGNATKTSLIEWGLPHLTCIMNYRNVRRRAPKIRRLLFKKSGGVRQKKKEEAETPRRGRGSFL